MRHNKRVRFFLRHGVDAKASFSTLDQLRCAGVNLTLAKATGLST